MAKARTAASYARFSSDMQKDRSVSDQEALCERYAEREGVRLIRKFSDREKSGSSMFDRDGLIDLMAAAKRHEFDVVVVESLDRLSRDQEDLAGLFKRLNHYGVEILTVNEGKTTDIHIGVRGIVSSLYLKDLASKIKRGQAGLVGEGLMPGTVTYGYARVAGSPGKRVIDPEEAKVIRRIFIEYANGTSPRHIAASLTADGIPSPSGRDVWNFQTIISGGGKALGGIIGNRLYIGELVWNQHETRKDPDTGREQRRRRPLSDITVTLVPDLRIVDQELWESVQAERKRRTISRLGQAVISRPIISRGSHLLSGLLRCGACGGLMIFNKLSRGKRYVRCSSAHQRSTCAHRRSYQVDVIQDRAIQALKEQLTDPAEYADKAKAYAAEYAEQRKRASSDRASKERQLQHVEVKIARLVRAIEETDGSPTALVKSLSALEVVVREEWRAQAGTG
jgi:site-specific DNA recombinase